MMLLDDDVTIGQCERGVVMIALIVGVTGTAFLTNVILACGITILCS